MRWITVTIPTRETGPDFKNLPEVHKPIFCKVDGKHRAGYIAKYYKGTKVIDHLFSTDDDRNGCCISNMKSFEWLDESIPEDSGQDEIVEISEELWDKHSEHIDDNVSSLERVAGTSVLNKWDYNKLIQELKSQYIINRMQ